MNLKPEDCQNVQLVHFNRTPLLIYFQPSELCNSHQLWEHC